MGEVESEQARILREYYNRRYGLDDPLIVQYLRWVNQVSPVGFASEYTKEGRRLGAFGFKPPNLGESFSRGRPVIDVYSEALPITLLLNVIAFPIIYIIAILTGVYAARYRGQVFDYASGFTLLGLWSAPVIWIGVMLIGFLASNQYLQWFPASGLSSIRSGEFILLPGMGPEGFERGWLLDRLWHLFLPVVCLTYGGFAFLSKLMRASLLESLSADFVRTARAKGVYSRDVLWRHAFHNSLLPLITVAAGIIPGLLAGSVIVEQLFSIPGMGKLTLEAIWARDRELVLAGALVSGLLGLFSILLADLCYAIADPRVSYD